MCSTLRLATYLRGLASSLVELKFALKSAQVFYILSTQRKSTQVDCNSTVYTCKLRLFATCVNLWIPLASLVLSPYESSGFANLCWLALTCDSVWSAACSFSFLLSCASGENSFLSSEEVYWCYGAVGFRIYSQREYMNILNYLFIEFVYKFSTLRTFSRALFMRQLLII